MAPETGEFIRKYLETVRQEITKDIPDLATRAARDHVAGRAQESEEKFEQIQKLREQGEQIEAAGQLILKSLGEAGIDEVYFPPERVEKIIWETERRRARRPEEGASLKKLVFTEGTPGELRKVFWGGEEISLGRKQFPLLLFLAQRAGQWVDREEIVRGLGFENKTRMRGVVSSLRGKLRKVGEDPFLIIQTRRGVTTSYKLNLSLEEIKGLEIKQVQEVQEGKS